MCDADPSRSPELEASLGIWALQNDCSCVDLNSDTQFKQIWIFCITCAGLVCLSITLVILWTEMGKQKSDNDEEEGATEKDTVNRKSAAEVTKEMEEAVEDAEDEPNLNKALEHLRNTSPTKNGKWRPIWGTSINELSDIGGVGTELYFRFLKRLGLCFLYMAALTCISVAFNVASDFAPDNGQALTKTTIGNVGASVTGSTLSPNERFIILKSTSGCEGTPVTTMTKIIGWLDFVAIVLFIATLAWWRFVAVPSIAKQADEDDTTVKDFSVEIDKLPRHFDGMEETNDDDINNYETELTQHLEERMAYMRKLHKNPTMLEATGPPKVRELVLVRDFNGKLEKIRTKAMLAQDVKIATYCKDLKTVAKKQKKLDKITIRLEKKLKPEEELHVVRAFAIVNTQQDAQNLIMDYRFSTYSLIRLIQQCLGSIGTFECCCPQRQRFFHGRAIRIQQPPEPTNIIWENQDVPFKWRMLRKGVINLIFVLIVIISFVLVYAANAGAKSNMKSNNQLLGTESCDPVVTQMSAAAGDKPYLCYISNATEWSDAYLETNATKDEIGCWCGTMGYQKIMNNPGLITGVCSEWLTAIAKGAGIGALATSIVVIINMSVKSLLLWLAEEEKPLSESELNSSKMTKIWALQTLNTGFVIFCVNFHPPPGMPFGFIFLGEYGDSVRGWYAVVGAAVLSNMLANAVVPGSTAVVGMLVKKLTRSKSTKKQKHQFQLLRLYENPPFDIAAKFAQLLTTVFVTMTYSAGMPLLNLFAAGYMLFTYWCDKTELLWGSKRPPAIDTTMALDSSQYMLYSVALHCAFGIWMLGQPCTFPSNPVGGSLASFSSSAMTKASAASGTGGGMENTFGARLTKESTWMIFALLLVCIGLWSIWTVLWILGGTVGELFGCIRICLCPRRSSQVKPQGHDTDSDGEVDALLVWDKAERQIEAICPPASYKMKEHPRFRSVSKAFNRASTWPNKSPQRSANATPEPPEPASSSVDESPVKSVSESALPVEKDVAVGFLGALKEEYVDKVETAVGNFFDKASMSGADQEKLNPFEDTVRNCGSPEDATQAIKDIASKWGVAAPS